MYVLLIQFRFWNGGQTGDFASSYTERKSRFMKWFSKLFKGGSNRGRASAGGSGTGRRHPHFIGDENMVLHSPVRAMVSIPYLLYYYCICIVSMRNY